MNKYALFPLGKVVATPGAMRLLKEAEIEPAALLDRHQAGDWGVVCEADQQENNLSLRKGFRILSAYEVGQGKVWIITEADRSSTSILLPSEY